MPDYDLGRAHGEVIITADTRDATRGLNDYEQATRRATDAAQGQSRIEQELTRRRNEAEQALRRRREAEQEFTRVSKDSKVSIEEQISAELNRSRARDAAEHATRRLMEAERAYSAAVRGNTAEVRRFISSIDGVGAAHDRATRKVRDFRREINETNRTIEVLSKTMTSTLGTAIRGLAIGGGIGIAGGGAGLLGAGGIQGILAVTEAVKDFSGAALLMPAAIGGAAAVVGTLAVSFNGVADALKAMDDPQKFTEAIQKLAPAAAQAVTIIASFRDAMKGAMAAVQQSFFQPFVNMIQPIIVTWLPALMHAGQQIATVLGNAGRVIAEWLQTPATMVAFQQFIGNLTNGLQQMLPAITPILNAFTQLSVVGSQFFPQIAQAITRIANEFNAWVQGAAATGSLQAWIQTALTSFQELGRSILNVVDAAGAISRAFQAAGSQGFLDWLVAVTQEFKNWAESAQGASLLTDFFITLHQATVVLGPILRIVGETVLQLVNNLAKLGISMGPGITAFFQSLQVALNALGQALIASGPQLGSIIATLGRALAEMVQKLGPALPALFQALAQTFIDLTPAAVAIAGAIGDIMKHLTPTEVEAILAIIAAFKGISVVIPIIQGVSAALAFLAANPIVLAIAAVVLLVGAIVYAYNTSETFRNGVKGLWQDLQNVGSWIADTFVSIWHTLGDAIVNSFQAVYTLGAEISAALTGAWNSVTGIVGQWFQNAYDWGRNIVQRLVDGVKSMVGSLSKAWSDLVSVAIGEQNPSSPARKGPLSGQGDPLVAGQRVTQRFATGISAGAPAVSQAYGGAIGGGSEVGGGGFASAGISSGAKLPGGQSALATGKSGFDRWVNTIAEDLTGWKNLIQHGFELFQKVTSIFVQTAKVTATLWNRGQNPLTQEGGLFGPVPAAGQQAVPGVPAGPTRYGPPPLPNLLPKPPEGAPAVPQQGIPGVPAPPGPARPGGAPAPAPAPAAPGAPPPANVQGQQPATPAGAPPIVVNPDGTISSPNAEWQRLITRESGGRNVLQGIDDQNKGPNRAQGYFQITPDTWRGNGGLDFAPSPMQATPQQQAIVAGRIFAARGGQPWGAVPGGGREDEGALRAGLAPAGGLPAAGGPSGLDRFAATLQQRRQALPAGTPAPESAMQGVNLSTIPVAVQQYANDCIDASARIILSHSGVNLSEDQLQSAIAPGTNIQTQAAGLNKLLPQGRFVAMPGSGGSQQAMFDAIKASIDRGVGSILNVAPGSSIGGRNFSEGHFIAVTGYNPDGTVNLSDTANGKQYTVSAADAFQATQGRGIVAGTGVGPPPTGPGAPIAPAAPGATAAGGQEGIPQLPSGPRDTHSGIRLPAVPGWTDFTPAQQAATAGAGLLGIGGVARYAAGAGGRAALEAGGLYAGDYAAGASIAGGTFDIGAAAATPEALAATGGGIGLGLGAGIVTAGVAGLYAGATAFGAATGQESNVTPGVVYGPNGQVISAGPRRPAAQVQGQLPAAQGRAAEAPAGAYRGVDPNQLRGPLFPGGPAPTQGLTGLDRLSQGLVNQRAALGVNLATGGPDTQAAGRQGFTSWFGGQPSTPVHVTNPSDLPGGQNSSSPQSQVALRDKQTQLTGPQPVGRGPQPGWSPQQLAAAGNIPGATEATQGVFGQQPGQQPGGGPTALPFNAKTPMQAFESTMGAVSSIAGDAFKIFGDIITNIKAGADNLDLLVRGFANTEDVMKFIDNVQTFIQTAADVAHLIGDIGGMAGGASGGADMGAGAALQAIAGIVQSALEATNMAIDLGQEAWHQISKYGAIFAGMMLGNADTGPLSGNVRMLLNTQTGQVLAYSQDNPLNKATHNLPAWFSRAYGGPNPNAQPNVQNAQVNIYAGPGQSPRGMMDESMWMVSTGAPSVMSAAGRE